MNDVQFMSLMIARLSTGASLTTEQRQRLLAIAQGQAASLPRVTVGRAVLNRIGRKRG